MERKPNILLAGLLILFCSFLGQDVRADHVVIGSDYTATGTVDGDLIIVNGSIDISAVGDLLVNGDVKITSGSAYMGPSSGKLRVFGDLIITNTLPSSDASIILHDALEVTGAVILRSDQGEARITTTGVSDGSIEAERIVTRGYGNSSIYTNTHITVVAEIDTRSTTSDAFIESVSGNLYAGSIKTDAYGNGYVEAEDVNVTGELHTLGIWGVAYVDALSNNIYAGLITTSGGGDAYVRANQGIEVQGSIRTTSTSDRAFVLATTSSVTAGSIVTDGYGDSSAQAQALLVVNGDISTRSANNIANVVSGSDDIIAINISTDGYTHGYVSAPKDILARRNIYTLGRTGDAFVFASGTGDVFAYSITTSGATDCYVESDTGYIRVKGVIYTNSTGGSAHVEAAQEVFAESVLTNAATNGYLKAGGGNLDIKDRIDIKSSGGVAYVETTRDIIALSVSTNAATNGYVTTSNGNIKVVGDIRTNATSGNGYVWALNGDIDARSIKTIAGSDDSIKSAYGSGRFELFPNLTDSALTIKDSEFYLDSDHDWNTILSFEGTCTLDGNGNNLVFGSGGGLLVKSNATLVLRNILIDNVGGNVIRCEDNTATLSIYNVRWTQTSDVLFANGTMQIYGDFVIEGPDTNFRYESTETSSIHDYSTFQFEPDVTLRYDTDASQRIWLSGDTSRLVFNGAHLYSLDDIRFTKGVLLVDNLVTFSLAPTKKCYFGNGILADNLEYDYTFGSEFDVYGPVGTLVNQNV